MSISQPPTTTPNNKGCVEVRVHDTPRPLAIEFSKHVKRAISFFSL